MLLYLSYALQFAAIATYIIHSRSGLRWIGRLATGVATTSWSLLSIALLQRGLIAGHWPLTNRYEVALSITWAILIVYILFETSWQEKRAGAFVILIATLMTTYALTRPTDEKVVLPLLPILRSLWLQVHVLSTLIGYGALGVATGLGLTRLTEPATSEGQTRMWLPPIERTERAIERVVAIGFPWLTLGIITGGIWAQQAWGRYWGWDPKETWTLVTWMWYLMILHVRGMPAWRGRRLAWLVVSGYGLVIFTFVGVSWLIRVVRLESLHGT